MLPGVFTSDGTMTTTIADTNGKFNQFNNDPSINDTGTVAFSAGLDAGGSGIFTSDGTITSTIVANDFSTGGSVSQPAINNSGVVAFNYTTRFETIVKSDGTNSVEIANAFGPLSAPAINDAGIVAYSYVLKAIITSDRTTSTTIANAGDNFIYNSPPSLNNAGIVAYTKDELARGEGSVIDSQLLISDSTSTTTIADSSGDFSDFTNTSINDENNVAFIANLDAGGKGIFIVDNLKINQVIATGDFLFSYTIVDLDFSSEGLNNSGQVTFTAKLANNTQVIVRANPKCKLKKPKQQATSIEGWKKLQLYYLQSIFGKLHSINSNLETRENYCLESEI